MEGQQEIDRADLEKVLKDLVPAWSPAHLQEEIEFMPILHLQQVICSLLPCIFACPISALLAFHGWSAGACQNLLAKRYTVSTKAYIFNAWKTGVSLVLSGYIEHDVKLPTSRRTCLFPASHTICNASMPGNEFEAPSTNLRCGEDEHNFPATGAL